MDEMQVGDFSLERNPGRPNKLINSLYQSKASYFDGDVSKIDDNLAAPRDFLARTYIDLVKSVGRNEPDDRVGTIEVVVGETVNLAGNLLAVVIPDILWNDKADDSWLGQLQQLNVEILPFRYLHGREPEHHHAMIEAEVRGYYERKSHL